MSSDIFNFAGVMFTLLAVAILGYAGFSAVSAFSRRVNRGPLPPTFDPNEILKPCRVTRADNYAPSYGRS